MKSFMIDFIASLITIVIMITIINLTGVAGDCGDYLKISIFENKGVIFIASFLWAIIYTIADSIKE